MNSTLKVDLLFNVLSAMTLMFLIILLILKTDDSKPAIEDRNRLVVTMEWLETSNMDVDMWIEDPAGRRVGYLNKKGEGIVLQRDDTGFFSDKVTDAEGKVTYTLINREILNIRQLIPGRYTVNLIMYSNKETRKARPKLGITRGPVKVETNLLQADPFKKWVGKEVTMHENCQEFTVLAFDVTSDDEVILIENAPQIDMELPCTVELSK